MTDRDRLIELIKNAPTTDTVYGNIKLQTPIQTVQTIADYLLANNVVKVVRCKDCRLFVNNQEALVMYCKRELKNLKVKPTDFCSYGELKEGNNNA